MNLKIIIGTSMLFIGCGNIKNKYDIHDWGIYQKPSYYNPPGTISVDDQAYIDQYTADASKYDAVLGHSNLVSVTWQDDLMANGVAVWGYCQTYIEPDNSLTSTIYLDNKLNTLDSIIKKLIIYHELSHGLLGVGHTTHDESNVLQIMYWSSGAEQENNVSNYNDPIIWGQYLDFLFTQTDLEVSL